MTNFCHPELVSGSLRAAVTYRHFEYIALQNVSRSCHPALTCPVEGHVFRNRRFDEVNILVIASVARQSHPVTSSDFVLQNRIEKLFQDLIVMLSLSKHLFQTIKHKNHNEPL